MTAKARLDMMVPRWRDFQQCDCKQIKDKMRGRTHSSVPPSAARRLFAKAQMDLSTTATPTGSQTDPTNAPAAPREYSHPQPLQPPPPATGKSSPHNHHTATPDAPSSPLETPHQLPNAIAPRRWQTSIRHAWPTPLAWESPSCRANRDKNFAPALLHPPA